MTPSFPVQTVFSVFKVLAYSGNKVASILETLFPRPSFIRGGVVEFEAYTGRRLPYIMETIMETFSGGRD